MHGARNSLHCDMRRPSPAAAAFWLLMECNANRELGNGKSESIRRVAIVSSVGLPFYSRLVTSTSQCLNKTHSGGYFYPVPHGC